MYKYEQPSMFSGVRGMALLIVILLHVVVGYAFYAGLASRLVQTIIPPVEIAQIDKPKDVDKPPPPPPKLEEIKPYVPPPEFVDIAAPAEPTNAIAVVTQTVAPVAAPVVAAAPPAPKAATNVKMDPKHPLKIGEEYYPDASKRANEEGRCIVQVTVSADGRITSESLQTSSGFPRLDDACLKGVHGLRMIPATEDGKPVEKTASLPIVWKLTK
jgi:periplasmic protein TonB